MLLLSLLWLKLFVRAENECIFCLWRRFTLWCQCNANKWEHGLYCVLAGNLLCLSGIDWFREHINWLCLFTCDLMAFSDTSTLHRHISHHSLVTLVISSPFCSCCTLGKSIACKETISLLCWAAQWALYSQSNLNTDQSAALDGLKLTVSTICCRFT